MYLPRLLAILQKISGDNNGKPYASRLRSHFPHLQNERDIFEFLVSLEEIIGGAFNEIDSISAASDDTKEKMRRIIEKSQVLTSSSNFSKSFSAVVSAIPSEAELQTIYMFCDMSGIFGRDVRLPEDEVGHLAKELGDIIDYVRKSNLEENIKFHTVLRLSSLLSAIQGFEYLGEEVFWKEFGSLSALVYRRKKEFEGESPQKESGTVLDKLGSYMEKAAGIMTKSEGVVKSGLSIADMAGLVPKAD